MKHTEAFDEFANHRGESGNQPQTTRFGTSQNIMIPVKLDKENNVTHMFVVNYEGFPENGLENFFDITGIRFREGLAGMTVYQGPLEYSLLKGYIGTLLKIARSIDQCEQHTRFHSTRTGLWALKIAQSLGLDSQEVESISLAGKIHDIGKVFIPKSILTKPASLKAEEWDLVKQHPILGSVLMKPSQELKSIIPYVKAHHENFDGSGYPAGLAGEEIPLGARILTVADAFTTITEGRVYKKAATFRNAITELVRCSGKQFDPLIVSTIEKLVISGDVRDWMGRW
ncbi:MAG: HD domain-containing protein [Anaerolineaceae bacterium]|nr:HD domain-containing protein [Anaerolineaceae bacterium]